MPFKLINDTYVFGINRTTEFSVGVKTMEFDIAPNMNASVTIELCDETYTNPKALFNIGVSNGSLVSGVNFHSKLFDIVTKVEAEFNESIAGALPHLESIELNVQKGKIGYILAISDDSVVLGYSVTASLEATETSEKSFRFVFEVKISNPYEPENAAKWGNFYVACNDVLKAVEEGEEKSEEVVPAISTMLSKEWIGVDTLLLILIFILTRVPV